jgi:hypothetical protein
VSAATFFIVGLPIIQARGGIKQIVTGTKVLVEEAEETRRSKRPGEDGT